jgi:hypothetical protein
MTHCIVAGTLVWIIIPMVALARDSEWQDYGIVTMIHQGPHGQIVKYNITSVNRTHITVERRPAELINWDRGRFG